MYIAVLCQLLILLCNGDAIGRSGIRAAFFGYGDDSDSSDDDLNHFLLDDAKNYLKDLMAVTYLLVDKNHKQVEAYFSLLNDKVAYDPQTKGFWNRLNRHIPNNKRRKSYPSVKIGRLAVGTEYTQMGIGSDILLLIKRIFSANKLAGCRFVTVDAYSSATDFYKKNGFSFFTTLDVLEPTRLMYFDLKPFKEQRDNS